MATEIMEVPLPVRRALYWSEDEIKIIYENWISAMKLLSENRPIVSQEYSYCLQSGRATILEKMMELITNNTYFKPQCGSGAYTLNWKDAPHCLAKFLQQLESVFTGNKEIKIRKKIRDPAVRLATSVAPIVSVPQPTEYWKEDDINTLFDECHFAMELLENNPAIISTEYKQCLQRGRDVIIQNMLEFTMDPESFKKEVGPTEYLFYWKGAPAALEEFLQKAEVVFTRDEELQISTK